MCFDNENSKLKTEERHLHQVLHAALQLYLRLYAEKKHENNIIIRLKMAAIKLILKTLTQNFKNSIHMAI